MSYKSPIFKEPSIILQNAGTLSVEERIILDLKVHCPECSTLISIKEIEKDGDCNVYIKKVEGEI